MLGHRRQITHCNNSLQRLCDLEIPNYHRLVGAIHAIFQGKDSRWALLCRSERNSLIRYDSLDTTHAIPSLALLPPPVPL